MYSISHIGVIVKDIGRSTDFYCNILGCKVVDKYEDERLKIVFLDAGNGIFELIQYLTADNQRSPGIVDHIAFDAEDVDAAVARAKDMGVKMLFDAPKIALGGRKKIMFFEGPDGERLEFIQDLK